MKILITGATGFVGRTLIPLSVQSFIDRYLSVGKGQTESRKHVLSLLGNNCYDRGRMVQAGYRLFS